MTIKLNRRTKEFNFYESFSDLVFCTLVLFVCLVMVLAMNVGVQVELVQKEQDDLKDARTLVEQTQAKLAESSASLENSTAELVSQKAQFEQTKTELSASQKRLSDAENALKKSQLSFVSTVGSNRFTGISGVPTFFVAIDVRKQDAPKYYFVPSELNDMYAVPFGNESSEEKIARELKAIQLADSAINEQRGFSEIEMTKLVSGASSYIGIGDRRRLNLIFKLDPTSGKTSTEIGDVLAYSSFTKEDIGWTVTKIGEKVVTSFDDITGYMGMVDPHTNQVNLELSKGKERKTMTASLFRETVLSPQLTQANIFSLLASGLKSDVEEFVKTGNGPTKFIEVTASAKDIFLTGLSDENVTHPFRDEPNSVLKVNMDEKQKSFAINGIQLTVLETQNMLQSISRGSIVVEFEQDNKPVEKMPDWVTDQLLKPVGFVHRAPNLTEVEKWFSKQE